MSVFACLLLTVLPWLAPQQAAGKEPSGAIKGRIVDAATGAPIAQAVVRLIDETGLPVSIVSDRDGQYAFTRLKAGRYRLVAEPGEFVRRYVERMYEGEPSPPKDIIVLRQG